MFTAFPCCLDPDHPGEHMFAGYRATYRVEDGLVYEQGRQQSRPFHENDATTEDLEAQWRHAEPADAEILLPCPFARAPCPPRYRLTCGCQIDGIPRPREK